MGQFLLERHLLLVMFSCETCHRCLSVPFEHIWNECDVLAMQSELAMLRAEVRTLADQLKDAENLASSQVRSSHRIHCLSQHIQPVVSHRAWSS